MIEKEMAKFENPPIVRNSSCAYPSAWSSWASCCLDTVNTVNAECRILNAELRPTISSQHSKISISIFHLGEGRRTDRHRRLRWLYLRPRANGRQSSGDRRYRRQVLRLRGRRKGS